MTMKRPIYSVRIYENGQANGYFIGPHGPVIFFSKRAAEIYATTLNETAIPGHWFKAETIED